MALVLPAPLWGKVVPEAVLGIETTKLLPLVVLTQWLSVQVAWDVDAQAARLMAAILIL